MIARLNLKWLVINALALLLLLVGLSIWQQQVEESTSKQAKTYKPDYFMLEATNTQYDQAGQLSSS